MKRLDGLTPEWATRFLSHDPADKLWTCATCGDVPPIALGSGWYARRRCACEQQAEDARQREASPRTLAQALTRAQVEQVYTWLGRSWISQRDCEQLERCTFASFDRTRQPDCIRACTGLYENTGGHTRALWRLWPGQDASACLHR